MPRGPENGAARPVFRSTPTFSYSVPILHCSRGLPAWCSSSMSCSTLSIGVACALSWKSVIGRAGTLASPDRCRKTTARLQTDARTIPPSEHLLPTTQMPGTRRATTGAWRSRSERDHGARHLALLERGERLVHLRELVAAGDELVELELAGTVEIDH